jgi:hypothetical protein
MYGAHIWRRSTANNLNCELPKSFAINDSWHSIFNNYN